MSVKTRHAQYDIYAPKWRRVRDVVAGQDAIYAGTFNYLPSLVEEPIDAYLARLGRTPFYNATWRTIASFVGLLFRKPPVLEVPKQLEELLKDVTMSGVSFANFAQDVTLEDFEVARVGVLVDFPVRVFNTDGTPLSRAQADAKGLRPSMTLYKAENIANWRYEYINNHRMLTQVRLLEKKIEVKDEFTSEEIDVIRVLDLFFGQYRVRWFKEESGAQIGAPIFPLMNGKPLDYIPFYIIGPDGGEGDIDEPIMIDLVDLNLKHFQVSADYEHGCHMTALPTPVITGAQSEMDSEGNAIQKSYYIGSTVAWLLPMGADAKFLEFQGSGLQALEKNLDRKEAQMAAIGARMLTAEKAGVEAADTVAMRHSGEHSILAAVAIAVSEGLGKALKTFAEWAGVTVTDENVKFEINRDFMPFPMTPQALTALLSAVQSGNMSQEAFFDLMKRGDLHEADLTFEDEQARIDATPPMALQLQQKVLDTPIPEPGAKPGETVPPKDDKKPTPKKGDE